MPPKVENKAEGRAKITMLLKTSVITFSNVMESMSPWYGLISRDLAERPQSERALT